MNNVANVSKLRNVIDYVGSDLRHFDKVQTEICLSIPHSITLPIIRKLKYVFIGHGYQVGVICSSDLKA